MKPWYIKRILSLPYERSQDDDASSIQAVEAIAIRILRREIGVGDGAKILNRAAAQGCLSCPNATNASGVKRIGYCGSPCLKDRHTQLTWMRLDNGVCHGNSRKLLSEEFVFSVLIASL